LLTLNITHTHSKEKWDASGGNEAISRLSASIPQGTKDSLGSAAKNLFNKEHFRSVTVFFGIGEERPFYLEKSPSLLMARLRHNFTFFYLNYMVVFGILFVLTMVTSITTMIGLLLLGGAWLYVIRASSEGHLKIVSKSSHTNLSTVVASPFGPLCLLDLDLF
jgi:hypothetical protein